MNLRDFSTLHLALGVSLALHAGVLTLRCVDPRRFNRVFEDTPLEVILVNSQSTQPPDKAQAIAQATLAGGGDAETGRATSPLPPSALVSSGDEAEDAQRKLEALQEKQALMLAEVKKQLAALPPPDPKLASDTPEAVAREEKRRQSRQAAGRDRKTHQRRKRPAQEALHQPGHPGRGLRHLLRQPAAQN